jgi:exopolysaccharide biosynthesis WecB/TagA/CpsF family protein
MTMTERIWLAGMEFDPLTHSELVEFVAEAIERGDGGTIVTPNVDICRRARRDPASMAHIAGASLCVPDGTPLLWAARLAGRPLVERITGADLIYSLSRVAAEKSWPVYLLGGEPGTAGRPGVDVLQVAGSYSPPAVFNAETDDIERIRADLRAVKPALVFVGLGFPKQEQLIGRLRGEVPDAWFVGCGAAIAFAAGQARRAPAWVQRLGLEWMYRLSGEPRRLARRYLVDDLPYALRLLVTSAWQRGRSPAG